MKKEEAQVPAVQDREITYVPMGEREEIKLTIGTVRKFLAVKTKSGKEPDEVQIVKFLMLCKARALNPWTGDAFLVGYDGQDGPQFSLITGISALLKRAESCPEFDGIEDGLLVRNEAGEVEEVGEYVTDERSIVGAWAKVYRKDRRVPFVVAIKRSTYDTGRSRWGKDPAGMCIKVARAAGLRLAFPNAVADLYIKEEMPQMDKPEVVKAPVPLFAAKPRKVKAEVKAEEPEVTPPAEQPKDEPPPMREPGADEDELPFMGEGEQENA